MSGRAAWWHAALGSARGYLGMQRELDAAREAERTGADTEPARDALREAVQLRESAELLSWRGSRAEALRLGVASLDRVKSAAAALDAARREAHPGVARTVQQAEIVADRLLPLPRFDAQVTAGHEVGLRRLVRCQIEVERTLGRALLDARGLARLRFQRWATAALAVLSALGASSLLRPMLYGVTVRSSSDADAAHAADRAVDGQPDTAWVPGGGNDPWLELRFRPRIVRRIRLLNGDTQAARDVRAELYQGERKVRDAAGSFPSEYPPRWITLDTAGARCDRVRLVVVSHYAGSAGSIAEVEVQ